MKLKHENPNMPEEEIRKKVISKTDELSQKMKEQQEKFQKDMQNPENRRKYEEAQSKKKEEMEARKIKLTVVAKKIGSWGLKEHNTVLGPNTISYFRSKSPFCLPLLFLSGPFFRGCSGAQGVNPYGITRDVPSDACDRRNPAGS